MKVCDLTQFYSPASGGVKRYVHEKVRYLSAFPENRHLLIVPGERDERLVEGISTVCTIRSPRVSRISGYRVLLRLEAIDAILETERPDVIECGDPYQVAWKAVRSGQQYGIPVVGFYHSHFAEAYLRHVAQYLGGWVTRQVMEVARRYVVSLYNRFSCTVVPSPQLANVLREWGVENVETVDLGVDLETFHPNADLGEWEATRAELEIPPEDFLFLYVGRLAQEKNTHTLFEAFRRLPEETPQGGRYRLLVVGDGLQRPLVEALERETGRVHWIAYCSDAGRLARYYRCADLFVHPGVQETFGLVSLESQACGTPVVGIAGSPMDRIIQTDQSYWARENHAVALAEAMERSAADPARIRCHGQEAARCVAERFSWKATFDRLFRIYQSAIDTYKP